MIQAMTWGVVPTSGAGISPSGLIMMLISVAWRRGGEADYGALPGHPHGQGPHLVQRHVRVVADATLRRAEHGVVVHPMAGEKTDGAVVHLHRKVDGQFPFG